MIVRLLIALVLSLLIITTVLLIVTEFIPHGRN